MPAPAAPTRTGQSRRERCSAYGLLHQQILTRARRVRRVPLAIRRKRGAGRRALRWRLLSARSRRGARSGLDDLAEVLDLGVVEELSLTLQPVGLHRLFGQLAFVVGAHDAIEACVELSAVIV